MIELTTFENRTVAYGLFINRKVFLMLEGQVLFVVTRKFDVRDKDETTAFYGNYRLVPSEVDQMKGKHLSVICREEGVSIKDYLTIFPGAIKPPINRMVELTWENANLYHTPANRTNLFELANLLGTTIVWYTQDSDSSELTVNRIFMPRKPYYRE